MTSTTLVTLEGQDPARGVDDVAFNPHRSRRLTVRRSKTDQTEDDARCSTSVRPRSECAEPLIRPRRSSHAGVTK